MKNKEKSIQILRLKNKLQKTDYAAIKYAEGELTLAEYTPVKEQRREWRAEINRLQAELQEEDSYVTIPQIE